MATTSPLSLVEVDLVFAAGAEAHGHRFEVERCDSIEWDVRRGHDARRR
jgi:hypothetical protein